MRRLLFFLIFFVSVAFGIFVNQLGRSREVFRQICDLTADHFFRDDERLEDWVHECNRRAALVSPYIDVESLLVEIQNMMDVMEVSHFRIYSPDEDRRLWKGEAVDTGIRSRFVEEHLVVYRVLEGSPAFGVVRAGDEILQIEGAEEVTPWGAQHHSGKFSLKRGDREVEVGLAARNFTIDSAPTLKRLDAQTALVVIPSFRADFFDREAWRRFAAQFKDYKHLIVDLRENSGGNFAAMLRVLSTLQCEGRAVGTVLQPRKSLPIKDAFDDNTSDEFQLMQLDRFRSLGLVTFGDYGCYTGRVTVLVTSETSSVSEIFANSFLTRSNARVWGQPTAGDVVLAVWYDLPLLGSGFSVSIPEAVYLTPDKEELERKGVWPQRELYYDLKMSLEGKDSWVEAARAR